MLARWQSPEDFVVHRGAMGFSERRERRVGNMHAGTRKDARQPSRFMKQGWDKLRQQCK